MMLANRWVSSSRGAYQSLNSGTTGSASPMLAPCGRSLAHTMSRRYGSQAVKGNGSRAGILKLFLYSKPDCHLCHGLKEKIDIALNKAQFMPSELTDAEVEVRDITTNPWWEKQYGMVIPVLTVISPGSDNEVKVRRVPPRSNSDRVAKHILAAVTGDEDILDTEVS